MDDVINDGRTYPDWLHQELLNWSRWCWQGDLPYPVPPTTCASIEREYTRLREENTSNNGVRVPPNDMHAQIVDSAWRSLPDLPRRVLRAEYPQRFECGLAQHGRAYVAKRLGVKVDAYQAAMVVAVDRVRAALAEIVGEV